MTVFFTKMVSCGGDFILLNGLSCAPANPAALAKQLLRRKTSVGADGLVLLLPGGREADFAARFFSPNGSEAALCCGGALCAAAYLWERRLLDAPRLLLRTQSGVLPIRLKVCGRAVLSACIGEGCVSERGAVHTAFRGRADFADGRDLRFGRW